MEGEKSVVDRLAKKSSEAYRVGGFDTLPPLALTVRGLQPVILRLALPNDKCV